MEQQLAELVTVFKQYLQAQLQPMTFGQVFINYWIPIIQILVLVGGAIVGIWKYFQSKNREVDEKILNEVYAPLYNYLVKQETYRNICIPGNSYKTDPIIQLKSVISNTSLHYHRDKPAEMEFHKEEKTVLKLSKEEFLNVLNSVNIGLASQKLFTLLSIYEVIAYISSSKNKTEEQVLKASIIQEDIENRLRQEIFTGYQKYHKKLGLSNGSNGELYRVSEDQIVFDFKASEAAINELREEIVQHPELYTD